MQFALRLQLSFGTRLEESLKFRVGQADKGDRLAVQPSWCKDGRAREITPYHRATSVNRKLPSVI
jgi:hypothetical protein